MTSCVIACSKLWRPGIADNVARRTGWRATLVTEPGEFTAARLAAIEPQFVFLPHWSHKIPAEIYERWTCVVFHMTDLPYGRGGSPLQNLIIRGVTETKICALRCVAELDAGPVYLRQPLSLDGTAQEIYVAANAVIEDMIVEIIQQRPAPQPQLGTPTVFKRRTPEQGDIGALSSLREVYDYIRMRDADGYPRAFVETDTLRLEFSAARAAGDEVAAHVTIRLKRHDR